MACSSCGGGGHRAPIAGGTVQAAAAQPAEPGRKWVVKYPNGAVQEFDQEWAAMQAMAMSGGELVPPHKATPAEQPASSTG